MSDNQTATIAGGIVGGIIGGYFGNPQLGFALGSAIGGALVPPEAQTIKAPRLEDTKAQSDDLGTPLAIVYGTPRVGGYVAWVEGNEIREEIVKSGGGGKGGPPEPERETPRYFATFAVLLAEAPPGSTYRVRRVWADTVKIVDARPQEERSDAQFVNELVSGSPIAQGDSAAELARIESDAGLTGTVSFFDGSEDQKPPARMVADRGKAPGHRGFAWLYFEDLPLEDWGRRIPRITAEIVQDGVSNTIQLSYSRNLITNREGNHFIAHDFLRIEDDLLIVNAEDRSPNLEPDHHSAGDDATYRDYSISPVGDVVDETINKIIEGGGGFQKVISTYRYVTPIGNSVVNQYHYHTDPPKLFVYSISITGYSLAHTERPEGVFDDDVDTTGVASTPDGSNLFVFRNRSDGSTDWTRYDQYLGFENGKQASGKLVPKETLAPVRSNAEVNGDEAIAIPENNLDRIWIIDRESGDIIIFHRNNDGDYEEVVRSAIGEGLAPGDSKIVSGVADKGVMRTLGRNEPRYRIYTFGLVESKPCPLAAIAQDMVERAGLDSSEYDVSLLTESVRGYVATDTNPQAALGQLRQVFPFDIIQSGYQIKFVPRGGSPVATLTDEDLQAHEPGQEMPPTIRITHRSETDMPRRAEIQYSDVGRRLEDGIQRQQRQSTRAEGDIRARLPVAFTADEAVRAADVLLKDSWQAQTGLAATATVRQIALEPGDVITLDTKVFRGDARITQIDDGAPGLRELDLLPDGPGIYSSAAEGDTGQAGNDGISPAGPTQAVLLDVPALDARGLSGGYYYALAGPLAGWSGGALVRYDDGSTRVIASATDSAVIGYTTTVLGDGPATIWDNLNTLNVHINRGELESKTELQVLNGSNALAVQTSDGEWEILQYVDATLESDGTYTLSQLLRGRRGTERQTGSHSEDGARVVVLDGLMGIGHQDRSAESVEQSRGYAGVTRGKLPPEQPRVSFEWLGRTLTPYSPVHVRGFRDGSGDVAISWIRRTRAPGDYLGRATAPLQEDSEAYEVDVLDGNGDVVRTLETTSESVTYTASQQNTDFGSTQDAVPIRVYQISATVGRGWPAEETV